MSNNAGVWIDHRKAVIVELTPEGERTTIIESKVEKHPQRSGDSPLHGAYEARQVPADDSRQRALTGELNGYYDAVIAALHKPDDLLVFGPGEAKREFHKRLTNNKPATRVAAILIEDKMTDRQIAATVRDYFAHHAQAPG